MLTLFPPNMPMFRMQLNDAELRQDPEESDDAQVNAEQKALGTEVEKALSQYEMAVQDDIEASGDRPSMHEALLHLITGGNVLLHDSPKPGESMRVFPLSRFVVRRDPMGRAIEMVVHETVARNALPDKFLDQLEAVNLTTAGNRPVSQEGIPLGDEEPLDLYTHLVRKGERWHSYQECGGQVIPGTKATYTLDSCPFIPLRMYWVAGEDYGRSYVENYLGDLRSLEALTQAIVEASAVSAKVVFAVNPNGITKAADLQRAPNCSFVTGNADDVNPIRVEKGSDLRVALETVGMLNQRLAKAFMLMDGVRRDAERVTAEEIRALASELEAANGGLYSMLSQECQLPYVKRRIARLSKSGKLPVLPEDTVKPTIITGFEALGRGNDRAKLVEFMTTLTNTVGREAVQQFVNVENYIERLALSDGINTKGLIKTQDALQEEQAQAQQMQTMNALGPKAVDAMGKLANTSMQQQQAQQPQPTQESPVEGGGI